MHGLRTENSDEDVRYVTMPSLRDIISPFKNDEIKVRNNKGEDEESWDIAHFCKHLTHGNPTVYEVIRTDFYDKSLPHAETIRSLMPLAFDGRKILLAHIGYAEAQLKRYLRKATEDFYTGEDYCDSNTKLSVIWEDNQIRRVPKSVVAAYRVLAQAKQLLTTGDFCPLVKDYSEELHDTLMHIKSMNHKDIDLKWVVMHKMCIEEEIQELKSTYETLPDTIKHKTPDIQGIENVLCELYGVD